MQLFVTIGGVCVGRTPVVAMLPGGKALRILLVGVRGHGGEEVYSTLLRDCPPAGVAVESTFDFHASCRGGTCHAAQEVLLNRLVHPFLRFNMGFRVLSVGPEIDLVHVHTHPTVLHQRRGRPLVFSAGSSHYHYVRDYERWDPEQIRRAYARGRSVYRRLGIVDALINADPVTLAYTFSNEARQAYLDHGVHPEKIRVLYPGFDIEPPAPRVQSRGTTFLFMGRQPRRKGGDLVLAAFRQLRAEFPMARLIYVTDEPPSEGHEGVHARPLVPAAGVGSVYAEAEVFVNPTRAEGFGFANVEAQGHGLAVISSRLGAIPEVVLDGVTGLLIPPGDGGALLVAMRRLAADEALRRDMANAARQRFVERFSLATFQSGLRALYEEALDRAGRG